MIYNLSWRNKTRPFEKHNTFFEYSFTLKNYIIFHAEQTFSKILILGKSKFPPKMFITSTTVVNPIKHFTLVNNKGNFLVSATLGL